jgi:hypothetical protein
MIGPSSRYAGVPLATLVVVTADGAAQEVRYLRRRFVPRPGSHAVLVEHVRAPGDRLDLLAARYAGDPTQYWRLCDATGALRPEELEVVGRVIVVGLATGGA